MSNIWIRTYTQIRTYVHESRTWEHHKGKYHATHLYVIESHIWIHTYTQIRTYVHVSRTWEHHRRKSHPTHPSAKNRVLKMAPRLATHEWVWWVFEEIWMGSSPLWTSWGVRDVEGERARERVSGRERERESVFSFEWGQVPCDLPGK